MRNQVLLATCAVASLALAPLAAKAAVFNYTFRGVVLDGIDTFGRFGTPGVDLAGRAFAVAYRIDDATPGAVSDDSNTQEFGGSLAWSPLTATVSIEGLTPYLIGGWYGGADVDPHHFEFQADANVLTPGGGSWFDEVIIGGIAPTLDLGDDFRTLPALTANDAVNFFSYLEFDTYSANGEGFAEFVDLEVHSVRAGIPEPATWALLIAGFGVAGAALRRRRQAAAASD